MTLTQMALESVMAKHGWSPKGRHVLDVPVDDELMAEWLHGLKLLYRARENAKGIVFDKLDDRRAWAALSEPAKRLLLS